MSAVSLVRRHPLAAFFLAAYSASAFCLLLIGLPQLGDGPVPAMGTALAMFPLMVVAVAVAGVGLTLVVDGRTGLRDLAMHLRRRPADPRWFLLLLLPPAAVLAVLLAFRTFLSPAFAPTLFPIGLAFGLVAGVFEEIGWTGYAYPRMRADFGAFRGAAALGSLWGLWHLPVVDALGAASPHRAAWLAFFAAFVLALAGLRVLIAWGYDATGSLPLAQLLHASSTASLVVFGAQAVSPGQEALWYAAYAAVLWVVVGAVVLKARQSASAGNPARGQAITSSPSSDRRTAHR